MTDNKDLSTRSQRGLAVLALLLYAVLVDAALETFLDGSPVRMWVAATVATYLVITVSVWRFGGSPHRFGWSASATASAFVLLGLLAVTIRLPGGLTDGVTILGQPTVIVLSGLSAVAVAFAGIVFMSARVLPWWGRAALGALAVYGVAAFVLGIIDGTPYPNLIRGGSLWVRLPYWLQGAFVGALIAVPLAMVAAVLDAVRNLRAVDGRGWGFQQGIALGVAMLMAVSGFTMTAGPAFAVPRTGDGARSQSTQKIAQLGVNAHGPEPGAKEITRALETSSQEFVGLLSGSAETQRPTSAELANRLESIFPEVKTLADQLPRDSFDVKAVVEAVGSDPIKLFQWVTDKTCFVPYRGVLRGEVGVLLDRRGNSLDRALLLYALLRSAGQQARLAHAELPADRARALLERTRSPSTCGVPDDTRISATWAGQIAEAVSRTQRLERAVVERHLETLAREQQRVVEEVQKRVSDQTAALTAATGPPKDSARETALVQTTAIQDHWWVQWQRETTWVDLDSMLSDQPPGTALAVATETIQPTKPSDLPENLQHVVGIGVVVEQWRQGQLREQQVLSHVLRPFDLYGAHIVLSYHPLAWPQDQDFGQGENRVALFKQTALAQKEWLPVLSIGRDRTIQSSFTDSGDVNANPMAPILGSSAQGLGRGIGNLLGGGNTGRSVERTSPPASQLSAVWIEYELRSPGTPVRKIRRQVFDLIGPSVRSSKTTAMPTITEGQRFDRSLHLLGTTEILPLASQLSPEFLDHLSSSSFLENKQVLLDLLRQGDSLDGPSLRDRGSKLTALPGRLYNLALARNTWSRVRDQVYLDRPNVLSFHSRPGLNARGEPVVTQGFDIVENGVAVNREISNAVAVHLEQGVLDTNAEAVLVGGCGIGSSQDCGEVENVSEMFGSRHGLTWLVVRNPADPEWQRAELTADIRIRVEQDLAGGHVVVVPSKPVKPDSDIGVAWWKIQPETGQVLGTGRFGWGQSTTEYRIVIAGVVASVCIMTKLLSGGFHHTAPTSTMAWDVIVCGLSGAGFVWFISARSVMTVGTMIAAILGGVLAGRTTRQ